MRLSDEVRQSWAPRRIVRLFFIYLGIALGGSIIAILLNMMNEALK